MEIVSAFVKPFYLLALCRARVFDFGLVRASGSPGSAHYPCFVSISRRGGCFGGAPRVAQEEQGRVPYSSPTRILKGAMFSQAFKEIYVEAVWVLTPRLPGRQTRKKPDR